MKWGTAIETEQENYKKIKGSTTKASQISTKDNDLILENMHNMMGQSRP